MARLRPAHSLRTAESHATFFLPHLKPGMALLDLGCGPGSITAGLAARVAPGPTTGVFKSAPPCAPATRGPAADCAACCTRPASATAPRRPGRSTTATPREPRPGDFNQSWYTTPEVVDRIVSRGLATAEETAAMSAAWAAWGRSPGAFYAGFWCDAIGFAS